MRFIFLLLGLLRHLTAMVPHVAAYTHRGELVGIEMLASAHDDEVYPC